jgi:hypothetical protein
MRPKNRVETPDMFRSRLDQLLDHSHPLYQMANQIDWSIFEKRFSFTYQTFIDEVIRIEKAMLN